MRAGNLYSKNLLYLLQIKILPLPCGYPDGCPHPAREPQDPVPCSSSRRNPLHKHLGTDQNPRSSSCAPQLLGRFWLPSPDGRAARETTAGTPDTRAHGRRGGGQGWDGTHLHLGQVLHPPRDLPGEGDEVAHGQGPLLRVVQVAGVAAVSAAHVAGPRLAALSEEAPQGAVLGVLHNEEQRPWGQRGLWAGCLQCPGQAKSGQLWATASQSTGQAAGPLDRLCTWADRPRPALGGKCLRSGSLRT